MGVKIISDFNPTHSIYAIGNEKHTECVIEGDGEHLQPAIVSLIASYVDKMGGHIADVISDDEYQKFCDSRGNMTLSKKDVGVLTLWSKIQEDVTEELAKIKLKESLDIPDNVKKILPKGLLDALLDGLIDSQIEEIMNEAKESENDE